MPHFAGSYRSKLPKVETTIFTKMSQLASQEGAINLSQGFPDFNCDPALIELVNKYMMQGFNQYSHMFEEVIDTDKSMDQVSVQVDILLNNLEAKKNIVKKSRTLDEDKIQRITYFNS